MEKSRYGAAPFKASKSAGANALRLCYETRVYLRAAKEGNKDMRKITKSFNKYLERVLKILNGEHKLSRKPESLREMSDALAQDDFPLLVTGNLGDFQFEMCKELLNLILRLLGAGVQLERDIVNNIDSVVPSLITCFKTVELYVMCGQFFRDLLQYSSIHEAALQTDYVDTLERIIMEMPFEIASDACDSLKALLLCEKPFGIRYLEQNYDQVMRCVEGMCQKDYYYKRQSLSFLYQILTIPGNLQFADKYSLNENNLMNVMNMLREEDSVQVKTEVFYLFAVILKRVNSMGRQKLNTASYKIIKKNNRKLISFFEKFQVDREDEDFQDDRVDVIESLKTISEE